MLTARTLIRGPCVRTSAWVSASCVTRNTYLPTRTQRPWCMDSVFVSGGSSAEPVVGLPLGSTVTSVGPHLTGCSHDKHSFSSSRRRVYIQDLIWPAGTYFAHLEPCRAYTRLDLRLASCLIQHAAKQDQASSICNLPKASWKAAPLEVPGKRALTTQECGTWGIQEPGTWGVPRAWYLWAPRASRCSLTALGHACVFLTWLADENAELQRHHTFEKSDI